MGKKNATISDVANLAGVSKSTVSKHLNKIPYVSVANQKKIDEAIAQLNFKPNSMARGLSKQSTRNIGLVIGAFDNPPNTILIKSIEQHADAHGYNLILLSTNDTVKIEKRVSEILSHRYQDLDGMILANLHANNADFEELKSISENIVLVHRHVPNAQVDYAIVDSYKGGCLAARYLQEMGHTKIVAISGPEYIFSFKDRMEGFENTLSESGITLLDKYIVPNSIEEGRRIGLEVMRKQESTAIFAGSDLMSLGVLEAARELRVPVPDSLSIMGFDNIQFSALTYVPLTTIDGRLWDLGKLAVDMVIDRIEKKEGKIRQVSLEPHIIERQSTGKA